MNRWKPRGPRGFCCDRQWTAVLVVVVVVIGYDFGDILLLYIIMCIYIMCCVRFCFLLLLLCVCVSPPPPRFSITTQWMNCTHVQRIRALPGNYFAASPWIYIYTLLVFWGDEFLHTHTKQNSVGHLSIVHFHGYFIHGRREDKRSLNTPNNITI